VRAHSLVALALVLACSCGPTVVWSGRTPDRVHRVDVIRDRDLDFVVVDGKRRAAYRGVAGWSIALAREHIAFAARVAGRWVVVHDGVISRDQWDGIGELRLGLDGKLVYVALRDGGWYVVVDGARGPRVDSVLAKTLRIAGNHVAYVAKRGATVHAVVDGRIGPAFDGIGQISLDGDGRYAYAARKALDAHVVVNGSVGPRSGGVSLLELGPQGHVAYVATFGDEQRLVRDGVIGPAVESIRSLHFRDDGKHVAWVGRLEGLDVIAIDDAPIAAWSEGRPAKLAFRPSVLAADPTHVGLAFVMPVDGGERLVLDDVTGPLFDEVRAPVWSRDGRMAYAARRGTRWKIVVDDQELDAGDTVGDPVFSGSRMAYAGRRGKSSYVAVDGRTFTFDLVFEDTVAFSADGTRWGAVAGDRTREQLFIVIDGTRRVPVAVRELYSAVASGGGETTLREWTQAELDRPVPPVTPAARR
jgi:hypothetical protein